MITVAKLKAILENLPDDAKVVLPGSNHSYKPVGVCEVADAEVKYSRLGNNVKYMWEYYGEQHRESLTTKIEKVLVVS